MGAIGPTNLRLFVVPAVVWCGGVVMVLFSWLAGISDQSVVSLLAIGFVCFTASLVGQAPIVIVGRGESERLPAAMLCSIVFRAGSTLAGVIALVKFGVLDGSVAALGCGLWYALLLTADVWVTSKHVAMHFPASKQTPERT